MVTGAGAAVFEESAHIAFGNEPAATNPTGVREEAVLDPLGDGVGVAVQQVGGHADGIEFLYRDLR